MTKPRWHAVMRQCGQTILWLLGDTNESSKQELERLAFARFLYWVVAVGLGANAGVALWIGLPDLLWPMSLSAQLVGFSYVVASMISFYGVFNTFVLSYKTRKNIPLPGAGSAEVHSIIIRTRDASARSIKSIAVAAVVGLYIDLTIVFYSFHYKPIYVVIFAALALFCACLARITMPVLWNQLGKGLKATGISLAALGVAAQFWYQSVYIPGNTPVGMNYAITLGTVTQSVGDRLIQVNLTLEDTGSVPAIALATMVVVRGEILPSGEETPILKIFPTVDSGYLFFPNDPLSREFVVVASSKINALYVTMIVDFTRTTWLTLSGRSETIHLACPQDVHYKWYAVESNLRRFTQGSQVVYSNWKCTSWKDPTPSVNVNVIPYPGSVGSGLGILGYTQYETLMLP